MTFKFWFTGWLLLLEDRGIRVFDHDITTLLPKEAISETRSDPEEIFLNYSRDRTGRDSEVVEQDMVNPLDAGRLPAISTFNNATEGRRKRKEGIIDLGEARAKLIRYDPLESSMYHGKFVSGSEMGTPVTDEDMEVMVTG